MLGIEIMPHAFITAVIVVRDQSLLENCFLSGQSPISPATLFIRYSYNKSSKKVRGLELIQVTFYNCPGRGR